MRVRQTSLLFSLQHRADMNEDNRTPTDLFAQQTLILGEFLGEFIDLASGFGLKRRSLLQRNSDDSTENLDALPYLKVFVILRTDAAYTLIEDANLFLEIALHVCRFLTKTVAFVVVSLLPGSTKSKR